eukprot:6104161-Ditylum_brightwellii.AAC.1
MGGALRKRSIAKGEEKPSTTNTLRATRGKRNKTDKPKETPEEEEEKIEGKSRRKGGQSTMMNQHLPRRTRKWNLQSH